MVLIRENIDMLYKMKQHLQNLPDGIYTSPCSILSYASVGQHFRHIIEFYTCIEEGVAEGKVCYDERKRNLLIETDRVNAEKMIEGIIHFLDNLSSDRTLLLKACYSSTNDAQTIVNTSLFRELAYALDHSIHHLAIIKIALADAGVRVDSEFGVAPSTLKFRKACAQ